MNLNHLRSCVFRRLSFRIAATYCELAAMIIVSANFSF